MIINPKLPNGWTLFCDDIRQEVTGKNFFIGTYQRDMIFHTNPPVTMPQLVASIWCRFAPTDVPPAIEFRVVFENYAGLQIVLHTSSMDLPKLPPMPRQEEIAATSEPDAQPHLEIWHVARMSQLVIPERGLLRARAYVREDEIRLGTIRVDFQPADLESEQPLVETAE